MHVNESNSRILVGLGNQNSILGHQKYSSSAGFKVLYSMGISRILLCQHPNMIKKIKSNSKRPREIIKTWFIVRKGVIAGTKIPSLEFKDPKTSFFTNVYLSTATLKLGWEHTASLGKCRHPTYSYRP